MQVGNIKITAKKYEGDDKYSWAIFLSDNPIPVFTGLSKPEVNYFKNLVKKMILGPKVVLELDEKGEPKNFAEKNPDGSWKHKSV